MLFDFGSDLKSFVYQNEWIFVKIIDNQHTVYKVQKIEKETSPPTPVNQVKSYNWKIYLVLFIIFVSFGVYILWS